MDIVIKGIYKHYKGNNYLVEDLATDSETLEPMVVIELYMVIINYGLDHLKCF